MNTQELDFIGYLESNARDISAEADCSKVKHKNILSFKNMIQIALNPIGTVIASADA
jgi:hypothetical protein